MKRKLNNILVTGGAGFIGTNFIHLLMDLPDFRGRVVNLDALTYAGNPANLSELEDREPDRYKFVRGDIRDRDVLSEVFRTFDIDTVVHFAAESHVDRSIHGSSDFITTNIIGSWNLLETAREYWGEREDVLFHHVSTDEVYGSLGKDGAFLEETAYDPRSPYSASKASSDHLVSAWHHTYGLPVTVSNCSNNYGPWQFPEKLIPLMIHNILEGKALPVYGDGKNIRDWLYVEDHNRAVWAILNRGRTGETYNIGGENEWENIELVRRLCGMVAELAGRDGEDCLSLITYVNDRPGHDRRYAIDCGKIKRELGWRQTVSFNEGLGRTVKWYLEHRDWVRSVTSGEYRVWIEKNYGDRKQNR